MAPHAQQAPPYGVPPGYIQAPPYGAPPGYIQAPPYGVPPGYPPLQYPPYPYPPIAPPEPQKKLPKSEKELKELTDKEVEKARYEQAAKSCAAASDELWREHGNYIFNILGDQSYEERKALATKVSIAAKKMGKDEYNLARFVVALADPNVDDNAPIAPRVPSEAVDRGIAVAYVLADNDRELQTLEGIKAQLGTQVSPERRQELIAQAKLIAKNIEDKLRGLEAQHPDALKRIVDIATQYRVKPSLDNIARLGSLKRLQQMDKDYKDAVRQVDSARQYKGIKLYPLPYTSKILVDKNGYMYRDESGTISPAESPSGEHTRSPNSTPYYRSHGRISG